MKKSIVSAIVITMFICTYDPTQGFDYDVSSIQKQSEDTHTIKRISVSTDVKRRIRACNRLKNPKLIRKCLRNIKSDD